MLFQQRDVPGHPAIDCGMIDLDVALFHHFLKLTITDPIRHLPTDAPQDRLSLKMAAFEFDHRAVPLKWLPQVIPRPVAAKRIATEPTTAYSRG